jgi:lysozyme
MRFKTKEEKNLKTLIDFIKHLEGFRREPYICSGGKWTIGYGRTEGVNKYSPATTPVQEEGFIKEYLDRVVDPLLNCYPLTDNQLIGLSSFIYNIGEKNWRSSGSFRILKSAESKDKLTEQNIEDISKNMLKWLYAGRNKTPILLNRRIREVHFLKAQNGTYPSPYITVKECKEFEYLQSKLPKQDR